MIAEITVVVAAHEVGALLEPLTRDRTKAAVPFGGEYRIIDFALSNCLHSGLRRVLVLTGTKSYSLQKHLRDAWSVFNPELSEYVTPVPAPAGELEDRETTLTERLIDTLYIIERSGAKRVLLTNGGHIYRMDYAAMIDFHCANGFGATIGYIDVPGDIDTTYPLVEVSEEDVDAPRVLNLVADYAPDSAVLRSRAMGVCVIELGLLRELLHTARAAANGQAGYKLDFLAPLVTSVGAGAYRFGGDRGRVSRDRYWNEIVTLDDYFKAHMSLIEPVPPLDLYQPTWQIRGSAERNPPARTSGSHTGNEGIFVNSIVSNGSVISGGAVSSSVLFPRTRVQDSATVERAILFHGVEVGVGAQLRNCIVDKGVKIAPGDQIGFDRKADEERFLVTKEGIVVVPKGEITAAV